MRGGLRSLADRVRGVSALDVLPFAAVAALVAASAGLLFAGAEGPGLALGAAAVIALSGQTMLAAHRATKRFRVLNDLIRLRGDDSLGSTEVERIEFLQRRILAAFENERLAAEERYRELRSDA